MNTGERFLIPLRRARADIKTTRERSSWTRRPELSDRSNPLKQWRLPPESPKRTPPTCGLGKLGDVTKDAAAKAQGAGEVSVSLQSTMSAGRERQILGRW